MQDLLASYLFQYKKCPLPGVGSLILRRSEAVTIAGEKRITAPVETLIFSEEEIDAADLNWFIAAQKNISKDEAAYQLNRYCEAIKNLQGGDKISIANAGEFYKDADGNLAFIPVSLSFAAADIHAEKVIHPDRSHAILVGDTETTNVAMNEYYAEEEPAPKSKWWIFALVLFAVATAMIIYYFNTDGHNNTFGISHQYEKDSAAKTYKALP